MPDELSEGHNKGINYRFLLRKKYFRFFIIGLSIFIMLNIFAYIFSLLLLNPQTIRVLKNTQTLPQSNEELEKVKIETEFAELLRKECKVTKTPTSYSGVININKLPIKIPQNLKNNLITKTENVGCNSESIWMGYRNPFNITDYFNNNPHNVFEIFNEKSISNSYYFNDYPILIQKDGDITIYARFGTSSDGAFYRTRLYISTERKILLPNKDILTLRIDEPFDVVATDDEPLEKRFPNEENEEITKKIVLGLYQQLPLFTLLDINRILYTKNLLREISPN